MTALKSCAFFTSAWTWIATCNPFPHLDIASEDHQVGPRDFLPVLLLGGPKQSASLVQIHVVGPAVERGETLHAIRGAAVAKIKAGATLVLICSGFIDHVPALIIDALDSLNNSLVGSKWQTYQ